MKKLAIIVIALFCAAAFVSAQSKQRVAVLPSVGDLDPQGLILLTDKVREIATKHLPIDNFNILKQDVITKMIGEEELYRSCKEGVCIGDLAKKTNANYGARCDVVKLDDNRLVLKFELYSVNEEAIFETFTDYNVNDFYGMLAVLEARLPDAFKKMVSVLDKALTDGKDKTRKQQRRETKVLQEYKPTPKPEPKPAAQKSPPVDDARQTQLNTAEPEPKQKTMSVPKPYATYFQRDFISSRPDLSQALNPALLYKVNQMHASMAFYRWGLDMGNMGYQDFSLFYPYRYRHTIGLTVLHARNSMPRTRWNPNTDQVEASQGYQDLWMIGNYGVKVLPWFWAGANVKMRTQTQFGENAVSKIPGMDVGVYFNPIDHYRLGDLGISLMAQDILPTQPPWNYDQGEGFSEWSNQNVDFLSSPIITTSRGRVGVRYAGLNDNLVVSAEMLVDNAFRDIFVNIPWGDFKKAMMSGDATSLPDPSEIADMFPTAFRWGFHAKYMLIPQMWFKGGWTNSDIPYIGINYNFTNAILWMINYFSVDCDFGYSFIDQSAMGDERGLVMMLKASVDFGRTRE